MSDGYIQPYETLNNSRAKLIRLPEKGQRNSLAGRNFFSRFLSPKTNHINSRSESSSKAASRDCSSVSHVSNQKCLKSSSNTTPRPKPRTSISRSSTSSTEGTHASPALTKRNTSPGRQTKTTVTVHLSKTSKTNSSPNLTEADIAPEFVRGSRHKIIQANESQNWSLNEGNRSSSVGNVLEIEGIDNSQAFTNTRSKSLTRMTESSNLELNTLQVFRQPRYKERKKTERKIRQLEHLNRSKMCKELVTQLGNGVCPNTYENQNSLKLVEFINTDGFVTSSRHNIPSPQPFLKRLPPLPPPLQKQDISAREHIYVEIEDDGMKNFDDKFQESLVNTPVLRKRVSFATFHQPVLENDPFSHQKKIFPATFLGIVQVTKPLRAKTDDERRFVSKLCFRAVQTNAEDYSHRYLGKVDSSRRGECVYVILEENVFELRNEEGLVMVRHGYSDVSVVTQIEEDSHLFVYVGRCKFNGRVGISIRFGKSKHAHLVLNSFKQMGQRHRRLIQNT